MKITEMLSREDFYSINRETINNFYDDDGTVNKLFIYPKLNAVVTVTPKGEVIRYLLTEYSVRSKLKRIAAKSYVWICMNSHGLLASNTVEVHHNVSNNTLIYPCNKKIRIFDFDRGVVSVIVKNGFDNKDLLHEIEFRSRKDNPYFIPEVIGFTSVGYSERIIDGVPLARIKDQDKYEALKKKTYLIFREAYEKYDRRVNLQRYMQKLSNKIENALGKKDEKGKVKDIIRFIMEKCAFEKEIVIGFSHGDFQAGNIWIENKTNKVFVIDWESWDERSIWYDEEVLFGGLRPGGIRTYLDNKKAGIVKNIVVLEDILFQVNEMNSLPDGYGMKRFNDYINIVQKWVQEECANA